VSPGYFRTVGARLLAGREFTPADAGPNARVAILSRSAARRLFGAQPPLGKLIARAERFDPSTALEVVGIVEDARVDGLRSEPEPMLYPPLLQNGGNFLSAEFRIAAPASAVAPLLRKTLDSEGILIRDIRTLEDRAESTIALDRTLASLAAVFGALALGLAAAGLYGLLAYANARRTAEFGVRLAFGASRSSILGRVIAEASTLVILGIVMGLPAALAAARLTRSALYGIEPGDPATIAGAAAVLLLTAPLAALAPAWRASRLDPATALRHD
jgi:hypothetical protein